MPLKLVPQRDRKLNRLVKRGETRALERGEVLYHAGDEAQHLFLVRAGFLRLIHSPAPGAGAGGGKGERVVDVVGPGDLAGEEALLPGTPRRVAAMAGQPTTLSVLSGSAVRRVLQTSNRTWEAFLEAKEKEVALTRALSALRRPGGARARLAAVLLHLSARHGRAERKGMRIEIPLTHQLLADLSASHRSTVTTLLNDWIYEGALLDDETGLLILEPRLLAGN